MNGLGNSALFLLCKNVVDNEALEFTYGVSSAAAAFDMLFVIICVWGFFACIKHVFFLSMRIRKLCFLAVFLAV